jgi:chromosome segregation ATPase
MLAGHAGYLTGSYRRYTKKQLGEQYLRGERMLLIYGDPDIGEIREQLDSTTKDLQATKQGGERTATALSTVVLENQELKSQLDTIRAEIDSIKQQQQQRDSTMDKLIALLKELPPVKRAEITKGL